MVASVWIVYSILSSGTDAAPWVTDEVCILVIFSGTPSLTFIIAFADDCVTITLDIDILFPAIQHFYCTSFLQQRII